MWVGVWGVWRRAGEAGHGVGGSGWSLSLVGLVGHPPCFQAPEEAVIQK